MNDVCFFPNSFCHLALLVLDKLRSLFKRVQLVLFLIHGNSLPEHHLHFSFLISKISSS